MNETILIVEDEFIVANDLASVLEKAGHTVCAIADTVTSAKEAVDRHRPTWVLLDIFLGDESMGTELAPYLNKNGIGFIYISANTNQSVLQLAKATQPYGFLVKPFRQKDLLLMLEIARSKHEHILQFAAQRETLLQQSLRALTDEDDPYDRKLEKLPNAFQSLIPFDYMACSIQSANGEKTGSSAFRRIGFNEYQPLSERQALLLSHCIRFSGDSEAADKTAAVRIFSGDPFIKLLQKEAADLGQSPQIDLASCLQFVSRSGDNLLKIGFFSKSQQVYDHTHERLLLKSEKAIHRFYKQLSMGSNAGGTNIPKRISRIAQLKANPKYEGIVGKSAALLNVLDNVEMVAPTNVSVLILGESGTGKEKIAHNVHLSSGRKSKPFVTLNCAAMPASLVESELFGHEKGAFTGAIEKRIGKFEAANGGTLFLDEIGELPPESQVKLLRVLQEKKFEPVGSSKTIQVDVRIIAATNRNLEKEVGEGRFRLDLFYRLNVYPITLPPLRERGEDILILAKHFMAKAAVQMGRTSAPEISPFAIQQLTGYKWPGNIRELEHLIERTLIKTRSQVIQSFELQMAASGNWPASFEDGTDKTLQQMEMDHILSVLKKCKGKINGSGGAADILGLPPSTLNSKMKKLGIKKSFPDT